jgi:hypothetical protein
MDVGTGVRQRGGSVWRPRLAVFAGVVMLVATLGQSVDAATTARQQQKNRAEEIFYRGTNSFMDTKRGTKSSLDRGFDWTDDGCSVPTAVKIAWPPAAIGSWVFEDQCKQHDFGWRNFGPKSRLQLDTHLFRKWSIDLHFGDRMEARCGVYWIRWSGNETICVATSNAFETAVFWAWWG